MRCVALGMSPLDCLILVRQVAKATSIRLPPLRRGERVSLRPANAILVAASLKGEQCPKWGVFPRMQLAHAVRRQACGVLQVVTVEKLEGVAQVVKRRPLLEGVLRGLDQLGSTVILTAKSLAWLLRPPVRVRQVLLAMEFIGIGSIFIIALTGLFTGMVLALQMVYALRRYQAESTVGAIVALALTREISPVFTGLMVTARAGSAWAAELGNMRITEQIDALSTMGVSPVQYLLTPRIVAAVLMLPLLCVVFTSVGMAGTWLVAVEWLKIDPGVFVARIKSSTFPRDFTMGEIKSAVFGFIIAAVSCSRGFQASGGARGVGLATTQAVVQSAVSLLVVNYVLTSWLTGI